MGRSACIRLSSKLCRFQICREAESTVFHEKVFRELREEITGPTGSTHTTAVAAVEAAFRCQATAIFVITSTGRSVYLVFVSIPCLRQYILSSSVYLVVLCIRHYIWSTSLYLFLVGISRLCKYSSIYLVFCICQHVLSLPVCLDRLRHCLCF